MKRDYFLTFLLCGGLLLSMLTGCKSSKKVGTVESASVKAHNEFFQSVEDQSFQFRTLTARLNVDLDIPGKQMSSRVDMKMVKDSAFQLSVQPFLGIEIFRIELSRDTIKVVDRMNKRYMIENYSNCKDRLRSSSTSTICRLFSRIICLSRGSKVFPVSIIIGLS